MTEETCTWFEDEDSDLWETSCGGMFSIIEGTPSENSMKFCCYCGKLLQESLFTPEPDEE